MALPEIQRAYYFSSIREFSYGVNVPGNQRAAAMSGQGAMLPRVRVAGRLGVTLVR